MASENKDTMTSFNEVTKKTYKDQACFFLNAYYPDYQKKAGKFGTDGMDSVWNNYLLFVEVDKTQWEEVKRAPWKTSGWTEGNSLDELFSHKYLEKLQKVLTVIKFREEFRKIDVNFDKRMALIEFLLWSYGVTVDDLMSRPQGTNYKEIEAAQQKIDEVQKSLDELQTALEEQKKAVAELKAQEDAHAKAIATLEAKAHDEHLGMVARNKAANELAQLKEKDPTPLRKAKLTTEAAVRRVDAAVKETQSKLKEAIDYLEVVKKKGGGGEGSLWWMEKTVSEAKKYLPGSKKFE